MSAMSQSGQRDKQSQDLGKRNTETAVCQDCLLSASLALKDLTIMVPLLPVKLCNDVLISVKERAACL